MLSNAGHSFSPYSEWIEATPNSVPGKPAVTLDAGSEELGVSWTDEIDVFAITGFAVQYKESDAADVPATTPNDPSTGWVAHAHSGTATTATIAGLTDGTGYDVRVRATNAIGDGPWSDAAQGTPEGGRVPAKPARPTATAAVTEVAVSWTAPYDRGSAITAYHVQYFLDRDYWTNWRMDLTGTTTTITGLLPGSSYGARVRAMNAAGWSAWSPYRVFHTQSTVPGKPAVTVDAGNGELGVSWTAETGGSAIIDYTVQYKESAAADAPASTPNDPSTGWVQHAHSGTARTATIGGLTNGTGYDVRVLATNANGNGAWSDAAQGTPGRAAAPAVLDVRADHERLDLEWTASLATVTGYDVHYTSSSSAGNDDAASGNDPSAAWVDAGHTGTAASLAIEGLANGTEYRVRVRAVNTAGAGAWARGTGTPALTAPDAPDRPTVTQGVTVLEVSWTAPDDRGSPITAYQVQYAPNDGGVSGWSNWRTDLTGTATTITGLNAGTGYWVRVRARNAAGWGGYSPNLLTSTRIGAPGPPVGLGVTPGAAKLDLAWTAPSGSPASYDVHYTSSTTVAADAAVQTGTAAAGWVDASHTGTTASHAITGLTNGTAYRVRVRGVNAVGDGAWAWGTGTPKASTSGSTDASLSGLVVKNYTTTLTLDPSFSATTYAYAVPNVGGDPGVTVTPTVNQQNATVKVNGTTVASGEASGTVDLAFGANRIMVEVTAQAGNTRNYAVTVTRELPVVNWRHAAASRREGSTYQHRLEPNSNDMVGTVSYAAGATNPASLTDDLGSGRSTGFTMSEGDTYPSTIEVPLTDDALNEENETFTITIEPGTGYTVGSPATVTVTIEDNDPPAAPGGFAVNAGDTKLTASWTKPDGPVTGYQVRWKETAAPDSDATGDGTDPSTGWVEGSAVSSPTLSTEIASLTNGTGYDVQVRATDGQTATGNGYGAWSATQAGTPAGSAPPPPTAPTGLVSNFMQTTGTSYGANNFVNAQAFTAGSHAGGYVLSSIDVVLENVPPSEHHSTVKAELWSVATGGAPDAKIADLTVPSSITAHATTSFTAPADTVLAAGTSYFFLLYTTGTFDLRIDHVTTNGEDSGAAAGWSIANNRYYKNNQLPGGANAWQSATNPVRIAVRGQEQRLAPGAVTGLTVTAGDAELMLSWTAPSGTVSGYDVHYTSASDTGQGAVGDDDAASGSNPATAWVAATRSQTNPLEALQTLSGLASGIEYRLRVRARNANGAGPWVRDTGTTATAPAAPTDLAATPVHERLDLSWTAPSGTVTGYDVHYTSSATVDNDANGGALSPANGWFDARHSGTTASHVIAGLDNGRAYRVRVRGVNAAGNGAWARVTATPAAPSGTVWSATLTAKSAFQDLGIGCDNGTTGAQCSSASVLTDDEFSLGGKDYRIIGISDNVTNSLVVTFSYTGEAGADLKALNFCVGSTAYALSSFDDTASQGYWDSTDVGWSAGDRVKLTIGPACPPPPGAPGAVTGLTVTAGAGTLDFAWTAPSGAVTGYDVWTRAASSAWVTASRTATDTATTQTVTGLENGLEYEVRVRAKNAAGEGPWVQASGTPLDPDAPTAPQGVTATPGDGKLTLAWTAPDTWGTHGAANGWFTVQWSAPDNTWEDIRLNDNPVSLTSTDTSVEFTGVQKYDSGNESHTVANGTAYRLRIRATTQHPTASPSVYGYGPWVEVSGTPAVPVAPAAPTDLSAADAGVAGWLNVTWTAPSGPVTGYDVHYTSASEDDVGNDDAASGDDPAAAWVDAGKTDTTVAMIITGLTAGTEYRVRVRAVNAAGNGAWARGTGTPPGASSPVAPQNLAVTAGDGRLDLEWTVPSGSPTSYDVHYTSASADDVGNDAAASGADPSAAWVDAGHTGTTASHALTGLDNGTAYRVRVRGVNAVGNGAWARRTATPMTADMMPAPRPMPTGGVALWSATLTVQDVTVVGGQVVKRGCASGTAKPCTTHLTDTTFRFDGAEYGITEVSVAGGPIFKLNKTLSGAKRRLVLVVGGKRYAGRDAVFAAPSGTTPANAKLEWSDAGLVWSAGDTVSLSLVEIPTVHLEVTPNPVREGTAVSVTASLRRGLARAQGTSTSMSHVPAGTVAIPLIVTAGTAEDRGDYGGSRHDDGTRRPVVHINGGAHQRSYGVVNIPTFRDHDTDDETFTVALDMNGLPSSVVEGGTVSVEVTIEDLDEPADPRPSVRIAGPAKPVPEGAPAGVSVMLSSGLKSDVTVPLVVTRGSSEAGDHKMLPLGRTEASITIPAGHCCLTAVFETAVDADTDDETFTVALDAASLPPEVRPGDPASAAVTIADDGVDRTARPPTVTIAAGDPVTEGAPAGFTLSAAPAPAADLAVAVSISQWGDFVAAEALGARTVTIPAGSASAAFTVATVDDAADEPDGSVAAALRSGDGYELGAAKRARVAVADDDEGLARIVAKKRTAREGRDDVVRFFVELDRASAETVTVEYATADGAGRWERKAPATAGADYTAVSGTLTYTPGERLKFVEVPLLDDAIDEGTEYFLLRFSNPRGAVLAAGETQGLISNDDHLQSMWLARFGRTVGTQVTDAVTERLQGGLSPGAHATLAGQRVDLSKTDDGKALAETLTGLAHTFGAPSAPAAADDNAPGSGAGTHHGLADPWNDAAAAAPARSVTGRELLLGSAFHLATGDERSGPGLAAWGRVALGSFDGEHADDNGRTRVDGEVLTGVLGADADFGRLLAGVAVSLSEGDGSFDSPGADVGKSGDIESTMTVVSPYARYKLSERITAWGLAGWGTGDMTIRFDDGSMAPVQTDLSMQLGAMGARGELLKQDEAGGMDLALKADAFFVTTESEKAVNSAETTADASRVRLVLEGGRAFALGGGTTLRPSLELGVRHDGGDAETGTGVELGGGLAFTDEASGLSIEARARMLAAHADSDYREWGASATARLDPGARGRGLSFSLSPTIGATSSAAERLWGAHDVRGLTPGGEFDAARGLTAEAGYGLALWGDRFTGTPNLGFGMSDGGARDWRLGWRLTSAVAGDPGFEVSLDATRREAANDNDAEHGVMLRSLLRW